LASQVLVIHERLGFWARHLRPRLADSPVRVVETRSRGDLETALTSGSGACPVVLIDLASRPKAALEDLDRALAAAPDALALVLDPEAHEGVALLARELGATHVISGPATPPAMIRLLNRWLPLARQRAEAAGWSGSAPESPLPEPWNWLAPYLTDTVAAATLPPKAGPNGR
jgi:hypothetical protein